MNARKRAPKGFDYLEPVLLALENELRDKVRESNAGKRNAESMWPVLQIQHQRTRYVYDMHYVHHKISRQVLDYCVKKKLADAALMAKWKKPGYERLCSTYVINPSNYKFGTTSICRVPHSQRREELRFAQDPTTGCLGCASGKNAGPKNIFGNKYGQRLAAIQIAREQKRQEQLEKNQEDQDNDDNGSDQNEMQHPNHQASIKDHHDNNHNYGGDSDTDESSDEDDYGPSPAAGVWAGSDKLEKQSEALTFGDDNDVDEGDEDTDEEEEEEGPLNKKAKSG